MHKKSVNPETQWRSPGLTRRVGILVSVTIITMVFVWTIGLSRVTNLLDFEKYPKKYFPKIPINSPNFPFLPPKNHQNVTKSPKISLKPHKYSTSNSHVGEKKKVLPRNVTLDEGLGNPFIISTRGEYLSDWVSVQLDKNYTSNLLSRYSAYGGEYSNHSKTVQIKFINFDDRKPNVLSSGNAHEVFFHALDELGNVHCCGGDFFEIDLTSDTWKSRPPTRDLGNGTYSFTLQVHPDFAGAYNLTIILLFQNFEGFKYLDGYFGYNKRLRKIPITFSKSKVKLPELHLCKKSDFNRDIWAGRWTRLAKNDSCKIGNNGRYNCFELDRLCTKPWCNGSLGLLDSNGWVYSSHCSFRLYSSIDAWNCLNNRWIFFWGDSNNVDTIRNILSLALGLSVRRARLINRVSDKKFTHTKNKNISVRITNVYNGHYKRFEHGLGLRSLSDKGYRDLVKSFFNGSTVPDTIIFNSGLHDGTLFGGFNHGYTMKKYVPVVEHAVSFWKKIIANIKTRGLKAPQFIFRSTIASAGKARMEALNPNKMEAYNAILLEKLRDVGLVDSVIDDFDLTWPWHFDNTCSDGIHYGAMLPSLSTETGVQYGYMYFVDLMLIHVLFNAICPK